MDLYLSGISILSYYFAGYYKKGRACVMCKSGYYMNSPNTMSFCRECDYCDEMGE